MNIALGPGKRRHLAFPNVSVKFSPKFSQDGQALAEGMVAMLVLIALSGGIAWLFRLQDMALQATHASRALAFEYVRNPQAADVSKTPSHIFHNEQRWNTTRGKSMLESGSILTNLSADTTDEQGSGFWPKLMPVAARPWSELGLPDEGIVTASVAVHLQKEDALDIAGVFLQQKAKADELIRVSPLSFLRQTSILANGGHAQNHQQAQQRIAQSDSLWRATADRSQSWGRRVAALLEPVDAPWDRASPNFDWLLPWADRLPSHVRPANFRSLP